MDASGNIFSCDAFFFVTSPKQGMTGKRDASPDVGPVLAHRLAPSSALEPWLCGPYNSLGDTING